MCTYLIKSVDVIGDTIDNESVILNVSNGIYYACRNLGAQIWVLLEIGISREGVHELFDSDSEHTLIIDSFLDELIKENLIREEEGEYKLNERIKKSITESDYGSIKLEKYTDMKDLLDLDPVHEVYHHSKKKKE